MQVAEFKLINSTAAVFRDADIVPLEGIISAFETK